VNPVTWYTGSPKNGTHSVRLQTNASIQRTISTVGYQNIVVSYYLGANSLDNANEYLQALWYDGSTWAVMSEIRDGQEDNALHVNTISLPAGANNLSSFAIRFKLTANSTNDYGFIDDVVVRGVVITPTSTPTLTGGGAARAQEAMIASTPTPTPLPPLDVSPAEISSDQATIQWTSPGGTVYWFQISNRSEKDPITGNYLCTLGTVEGGTACPGSKEVTSDGITSTNGWTSANSVTLRNLKCDTTYYVHVRASTDNNYTPWSESQETFTTGSCPTSTPIPTPTNVPVPTLLPAISPLYPICDVTGRTLTVSWSPPTGVLDYFVQAWNNNPTPTIYLNQWLGGPTPGVVFNKPGEIINTQVAWTNDPGRSNISPLSSTYSGYCPLPTPTPTNTPMPTVSAIPTSTPMPIPTLTSIPTNTPIPTVIPTITLQPTLTSIPTATVMPPPIFFRSLISPSVAPTVRPTSTPKPSIPGDANGDGIVDGLDYAIWLNNNGTSVSGGAASGDFDGSGIVDVKDREILIDNFNL